MSFRPDPENPSEQRRTTADRLSEAPMGVWLILGLVLVVGFVLVMFLVWGGRAHG